ncbi:MAG: response regulator transcription factor [Candidatus Wallbacteria bacterium]|nr:response regulator transcription factor [Candidatus Wallbacteria bacterium]
MLKLFVVDDHPLVIRSLSRIMEDLNAEVVGSAGTGREFLKTIRKSKPDVIVLDYYLPDINGDKVLEELNKFCTIPVLVLTGQPTIELCRLVFACGAKGFISKSVQPEEIRDAAQIIKEGGRYVDPGIASGLALDHLSDRQRSPVPLLSPRGKQILLLLKKGIKSNKIAEKLRISPKTVSAHKDHILKKLQIKSLAELIHIDMDGNLID